MSQDRLNLPRKERHPVQRQLVILAEMASQMRPDEALTAVFDGVNLRVYQGGRQIVVKPRVERRVRK